MMAELIGETLIRKREVLKLTGWSNSTLYARIAAGEFKKGVRIGERSVAWPLSEVQAYIAERIAERDAGTAEGAPTARKKRTDDIAMAEVA
ncbi:helix-turn-helix transcriptional regulator [Paraburkholderia sp. SIMBA_027]|uniref:helix-turn-helix transcriptional regulator n=1 Tax=Paraburkholderia sp. SIMBA_027 TaxID=3085770 RepID=UPI00397ADEA2